MVLFPKNVLTALIMRFFGKKSANFEIWRIEKYDKEGVFFSRKKRFYLFKSLFFKKWEGAKYAGGGRPSCSQLFPREKIFLQML